MPIFYKPELILCARDEGHYAINVLDAQTFNFIKDLNINQDPVTTFVTNESADVNLFYDLFILQVYNHMGSVSKSEEDRYNHQLCSQKLSCHEKPVYKLALNALSNRLVSGAADGSMRLWHIGLNEGLAKTCNKHLGIITFIEFHPTKDLFYAASMGSNYLSVWCSQTGSLLAKLEHQNPVTSASTHESGIIATCSHDKSIMIWSLEDYSRIKIIPVFEMLDSLTFLPSGALSNHLSDEFSASNDNPIVIVGGEYGYLSVFNTNSARCVLKIQGPYDQKALVEDKSENCQQKSYGLHSIVRTNLFSDYNGEPTLALIRQSDHIEFYDPIRMKIKREFLGDIGQIQQMSLAGKNLDLLLVADASPNMKIFPSPAHKASNESPSSFSWGCHLVAGGHDDIITDITVSLTGEWVVTGSKDCKICLWRMDESGKFPKLIMEKKIQSAHTGHVTALAFFKTCSKFVSVSDDLILKVWTFADSDGSIEVEECATERNPHEMAVNSVDLSVNDKFLATASRDKSIKVWSFLRQSQSLKCEGVLRGHKRGVWSARFSPIERVLLSASGDCDIRLWNLKDFSCIHTFEGHSQAVYRAEFISDARQIISCDQSGIVKIWQIASSNLVHDPKKNENKKTVSQIELKNPLALEAHNGRVLSLLMAPKEIGFYTGGEDSSICYFKDTTAIKEEERINAAIDLIANNQLLDNYLKDNRFGSALILSLELDQPKKALSIIMERMYEDRTLGSVLNPILKRLKEDVSKPIKLLEYATQWNTRARTSYAAQSIFSWIINHWTHYEIANWPGAAKLIEERHYKRIGKLEEQIHICGFIQHVVDEFRSSHVEELRETMDIDGVIVEHKMV